jgi:Tfp pilus assembly protein PilF
MRLLLAAAIIALTACASQHREGPYSDRAEERRDVAKAEALYQEAKGLLTSDPARAAELLRGALSYDLYHGGAHNNLGVLLLNQDRLYDAAEEFEWARKLLPGNPEPRVNLALVLDRAGRAAEALDSARTALEVMPGNLPAMQLTAVIQLREGKADARTAKYLEQISLRSTDDAWRAWAMMQRDRITEWEVEGASN